MTTTTQELAIYSKIRELTSIADIDQRLAVIHDGRASPGRPYPDEVRWLCRRRMELEAEE